MKKIICLLLVLCFVAIPIQSYAARPFTKLLLKKIEKLDKKYRKARDEMMKDRMKEHEEQLYKDTRKVLDENYKKLTKKQVKGTKHLVDDFIGNTKILKDTDNDKDFKKEALKHLRRRISNKKMIGWEHRALREYLKNPPDLEDCEDDVEVRKKVRKYIENIIQGDVIDFLAMPLQPLLNDLKNNPCNDNKDKKNKKESIILPLPTIEDNKMPVIPFPVLESIPAVI